MTQTSVIELALAALPTDDEDLDLLIRDVQAKIAVGGPLTTDDLYDEQGLPR